MRIENTIDWVQSEPGMCHGSAGLLQASYLRINFGKNATYIHNLLFLPFAAKGAK